MLINTKLVRIHKIRDGVQLQVEYLYHTPFAQGSGIIVEESEVVDIYNKTVFVRHIKTIAQLIHSGCDWMNALDLHKTKPVKIPAWMGENLMKSHSYQRGYYISMAVDGLQPLRGYPCSCRWFSIHANTSSTMRTQWV